MNKEERKKRNHIGGDNATNELGNTRSVVVRGSTYSSIIVVGDKNRVYLRSDNDVHRRQREIDWFNPFEEQQLDKFVGREKELAEVIKALEKGRHVVITGMPGVGKTLLAYKVAATVSKEFQGRVLRVDMRGGGGPRDAKPPEIAAIEVLELLGQSNERERESIKLGSERVLNKYRRLLKKQGILLILDNVFNAEQVKPLLPPSPSVSIVTTRLTLYTLDVKHIFLNPFPAREAVMMLRKSERFSQEPQDKLQRVAELCGNLPLALDIILGLAKWDDWNIDEIVSSLRDSRLEILSSPDDSSHSIKKIFFVAYSALSPDMQKAFDALGVLPLSAPFTLDDLQAITLLRASQAERVVREMRARHILQFRERINGIRFYLLHDLWGEFARQRLLQWPAAKQLEVKGRYAAHFIEKAQEENIGRKEVSYLTYHLKQVKNYLYDGDIKNTFWLDLWAARKKYPYFSLDETIEILNKVLEIYRQQGDDFQEAEAWIDLANTLRLLDKTQAKEALERAHNLLERIPGEDDRLVRLKGAYFATRAFIRRWEGEIEEGLKDWEMYVMLKAKVGEPVISSMLGIFYLDLREEDPSYVEKAIEALENAERLFYQYNLKDWRRLSNIKGNLGRAYKYKGDYNKAHTFFEQAVRYGKLSCDKNYEVKWKGELGHKFFKEQDYDTALKYYMEALEGCRENEDFYMMVVWYRRVAAVYLMKGEYEKILSIGNEALDWANRISVRELGYLKGAIGFALFLQKTPDYSQSWKNFLGAYPYLLNMRRRRAIVCLLIGMHFVFEHLSSSKNTILDVLESNGYSLDRGDVEQYQRQLPLYNPVLAAQCFAESLIG